MHHATSVRQLSIQQRATRRNYSERGCGGRRVCNEGGARGRRSASVRGRAWGRSDGCAHDFTWLRIIRGPRACFCNSASARGADGRLRTAALVVPFLRSCSFSHLSYRAYAAHPAAVPERHSWRLAARRGGLHDERTCTHGRRGLVARQWDNRKPCARGDPEFGGRRCL